MRRTYQGPEAVKGCGDLVLLLDKFAHGHPKCAAIKILAKKG
jgi:hypothetical protein